MTYQKPDYAAKIYNRCDLLPETHDPTSLEQAMAASRSERFLLGVLYRREPGGRPAAAGADYTARTGVWTPPEDVELAERPAED